MSVRALSSTIVNLAIGDVWAIVVAVTDIDGCPISSAPTVTVTLPAGSTATPTPEEITTGVYRATYSVGTAGRYVARAVASGYGAADFAAYVSATTPGTAMPDADDVDDYLGEHSWTADELSDALDAEAAAQRSVCRVPAAYPADLRQALLRRVARNLAMRRLPLAMPDSDSEGGPTFVPGNDPEVRRLERPWRRLPVG